MNHVMKLLLVVVLATSLGSLLSGCKEESSAIDKAPVSFEPRNLQHGAKLFVNYCLNCHGASAMRYNRLRDIGLSETLIRDNLMFASDKVGDPMTVALRRDDAKVWFGAPPPDLSVIARARATEEYSGADWLYSYLRKFYVDENRPTGWNNAVFANVGMPHALWSLQGRQVAHFVDETDPQGNKVRRLDKLEVTTPGTLNPKEYDQAVADLVSYLVWMGEPVQQTRQQVGLIVIAALLVLAVLSYLLKREYWKDIH